MADAGGFGAGEGELGFAFAHQNRSPASKRLLKPVAGKIKMPSSVRRVFRSRQTIMRCLIFL